MFRLRVWGPRTETLSVVSQLLASLGHPETRSLVLGHIMNTLLHITTQSHNVLNCDFVLARIHSHCGLHAACGTWVGHPASADKVIQSVLGAEEVLYPGEGYL